MTDDDLSHERGGYDLHKMAQRAQAAPNDEQIMQQYDIEIAKGGSADSVIVRTVRALSAAPAEPEQDDEASMERMRRELDDPPAMFAHGGPYAISQAAPSQDREDAQRLDSRMIAIHGRDEFGEPYKVIHFGIDLRAAIDEARASKDNAARQAPKEQT